MQFIDKEVYFVRDKEKDCRTAIPYLFSGITMNAGQFPYK